MAIGQKIINFLGNPKAFPPNTKFKRDPTWKFNPIVELKNGIIR